MSDELRECPFCGASGEDLELYASAGVICNECHAHGPITDGTPTDAWNQRSPSPHTSEKNIESAWISVKDRMPRLHEEVLVLLCDDDSAIYAHPTVARLDRESFPAHKDLPAWTRYLWWAGVPGNWHALGASDDASGGWVVTHWMPLPMPPAKVFRD